MALLALCSTALLASASGAAAKNRVTVSGRGGRGSLFMESSLESILASGDGADHTVVETFGDILSDNIVFELEKPEWCENETESLTWAQRRQRMQQHETLRWAKIEMKKLQSENKTAPAWMERMVTDDENRGKLKWASQEAKRLAAEGKEVPPWMADLAKEDQKWANRWAACKVVEMKSRNEEVPQWMVDNGRKGIMEYSEEKAQELQNQIAELETEKSKEEALISSNGDLKMARQRMLANVKRVRVRSVDEQFHSLEAALAELEEAERGGATSNTKLKRLAANVETAYAMLGRILQYRSTALLQRMSH